MTNENPYSTPLAELQTPDQMDPAGSLESALRGDYEIQVGEVIREGWQQVKGIKGKIFLAGLIFAAVSVLLQLLLQKLGLDGQALLSEGEYVRGYALSLLSGFLFAPITVPLLSGMYMMVLKHVAGKPTTVLEIFRYFHNLLPLLGAYFIMMVGVYVGLALLILPGLFMITTLMFSMPLVIAFGLGPWEAILISFNSVRHCWLAMMGVFLSTYLILILSIIPLGIGTIWAFPLMMTTISVCFVRMYGTEWPGVDNR
jgi:hypothetical protein